MDCWGKVPFFLIALFLSMYFVPTTVKVPQKNSQANRKNLLCFIVSFYIWVKYFLHHVLCACLAVVFSKLTVPNPSPPFIYQQTRLLLQTRLVGQPYYDEKSVTPNTLYWVRILPHNLLINSAADIHVHASPFWTFIDWRRFSKNTLHPCEAKTIEKISKMISKHANHNRRIVGGICVTYNSRKGTGTLNETTRPYYRPIKITDTYSSCTQQLMSADIETYHHWEV